MSACSSKLHWSAATKVTEEIASIWESEGGPGGAVLVFDENDSRIEAAGGFESLATRVPFSADTGVRYASITKHVLASIVLRTPELISLDDRLGQHLAQLRAPMADVTVGQALDMTGGLPDVRETLSLLGLSVHTATEAEPILEFLGELAALNFPAGHEISYSNTGYRLVEAILKSKGFLFDNLVQEQISGPLGIDIRAPELWFDPVSNLAPGYWKSPNGWQLGTAGLHLSASGSLTGSARHLAKWLQTLLGDRGPGAGLLPRLAAPRHLHDGRETQYGLGLAKAGLGERQFLGHGGSHAGYKSQFLLDPETRVGVVIVSNREDTAPSLLALRVMAALFGKSLPPRSRWIPDGLYATEAGPYWLEVSDGIATFLGTGDTLYEGEGGWSVSLSAHMPMRLRWTGEAVEGEIGHAARRFFPVKPDDTLSRVQGHWTSHRFHASFTIQDSRLQMGVGPARTSSPLISLGADRLLMNGKDGPWPKRPSLVFEGDHVLLALNRSRILHFERG
ncbi:serine hydrolase domain-containing protein [Microvirga rosea]|uniref:serine hydrolase domain-containing protein n=1 Tax=Microvirga rosea TaxID=2715425 RepID=UPI001D0A3E16|nr:serine hydrolase domain-containing protein [Microvirga rosea]MCB8820771.1 beta-lactamase family protein [Microvirga rosea]